MKTFAIRLKPGQDLRLELERFSKEKSLAAAFIITCVGSLKHAVLRLAEGKSVKTFEGPFEITSLVGTLSPDGAHLHISIANKEGAMSGGHVKEGCIINTTAEVVIGEEDSMVFSRKFDKSTGFDELNITRRA
ncbi:DNA-binding protein [archaeon]|nr:DNA-binding protein [archaeon]